MIYQYPLSWPIGVPRIGKPKTSRFDMSEESIKCDLEKQLNLMHASSVVITCNVELRRDGRPYVGQRPSDTGVAVYFTRNGNEQCIACDKWTAIKGNIEAIAKTVEALRGIDRWGTGSMVDAAFAGFTAIPASASSGTPARPKRPWYDVLGVSPIAPREVIDAAYSAMQRKTHPDAGGSNEAFIEVQKAYEEAQ